MKVIIFFTLTIDIKFFFARIVIHIWPIAKEVNFITQSWHVQIDGPFCLFC